MDKTIQEGYSTEYVADKVLDAVVRDNREVMVAPLYIKAATLLRYICPTIYFKIMDRRAKKLAKGE